MRPAPGDIVGGKYRILRLIGDGGMGAVFEARHERLAMNVALKFLHDDLARRSGLASRFLQEAQVSARIQSPHVTRVTDVDQAQDDSPYIVMELLAGETLQQLLDRQCPLHPDQALDFALQILAGLEAAHAIGVVHRDLKPDNVFITTTASGPVLKLLDFGIAKLKVEGQKKGLTMPGSVMGTPEYMAPEQLYSADEVDARADLFAAGVILFEMLAGVRPVDGDNPSEIVSGYATGKARDLTQLVPGIPPDLVAVVQRTIQAEKAQRWDSAHDLRLAIAPFARQLSAAGRAAATPTPATLTSASGAVGQPNTDPLPGHAAAAPGSVVGGAVAPVPAGGDPAFEPTHPDGQRPGSQPGSTGDSAFSGAKGSTQDVPPDVMLQHLQAGGATGSMSAQPSTTGTAGMAAVPPAGDWTPPPAASPGAGPAMGAGPYQPAPGPAAPRPGAYGPPPRRRGGVGKVLAFLLLGALLTGGAIAAVVVMESSSGPPPAPPPPPVDVDPTDGGSGTEAKPTTPPSPSPETGAGPLTPPSPTPRPAPQPPRPTAPGPRPPTPNPNPGTGGTSSGGSGSGGGGGKPEIVIVIPSSIPGLPPIPSSIPGLPFPVGGQQDGSVPAGDKR